MENKHHNWCVRFAEIIEGSCPECERLKLVYPATGNLDYDPMFEQAMKIYPDTLQHHEDRAKVKREERPWHGK